MLHLYYGDGKGKTTCAFGLALRALGRGWTVTVVQFLKSENTGERAALRALAGATLLPLPEQVPFSFRMTEEEREAARAQYLDWCGEALALAQAGKARLLLLDEACAAVETGLLPLSALTELLDALPPETEVVLTGRNPAEELLQRADYVTRFAAEKHPYETGVAAREGIEF